MPSKARHWCDVCRDDKPDIICRGTGCRNKFHSECLRLANILEADDDLNNYLCPTCKEDEGNDEFCYICRQVESDTETTLIMCDGCPRSAHLCCLGLTDVPEHDAWYCPHCKPERKEPVAQVRMAGAIGKTKLGNMDICYVCQKGGKLIGCDFCEQSFHPVCIAQEFLEFDNDKEWSCPLCRGEDPLKNMHHKRMSKSERVKMTAEWQKGIRRDAKRCRQNRDLFLWKCKDSLQPFVSPKTMQKIKKAA
eukprot:Lankesteria_metandrocarpae@DN6428_c0_g1_i1.p1